MYRIRLKRFAKYSIQIYNSQNKKMVAFCEDSNVFADEKV